LLLYNTTVLKLSETWMPLSPATPWQPHGYCHQTLWQPHEYYHLTSGNTMILKLSEIWMLSPAGRYLNLCWLLSLPWQLKFWNVAI